MMQPGDNGEIPAYVLSVIRVMELGRNIPKNEDEITLKAEVRDAIMNYHLVWEASDNDGRGWYAVGSGERYSFFLSRENIGREYRVSVIAVE